MNTAKYLYYKGIYYDKGTKVKMKTKFKGVITTTFLGGTKYEGVYETIVAAPSENYIIEIIKPVYAPGQENDEYTETNSKYNLRQGDIQIGWIWYILIMIVGSIFNDRWIIWIMATVIFFIWKGRKHKGGKKQ